MRSLNQEQKYKFNILPWFAVGIFSINLLVLTLLIFNASMLGRKSNQIPSTLGQLLDGRAITLEPQPHYQRYSETIRKFVGETLILIFTSSQQRPSTNISKLTSDLFAPQLQTQLTSQIQLNTNNQDVTSIFIIEKISQPQVVRPGVWQLNINARRIIFRNQDMTGTGVEWQKKLIVKATNNPPPQLNKLETPLSQVVSKLQKKRLQITKICDLKHQNCISN